MPKRGRPPNPDVLTPAEWRVAEGVRHGLSNPQIGERQGVSVDAVKYHVANILIKLQLKNRRELRLWDGVRIASALHVQKNASGGSKPLGPIGQISRTVKDIAAAEAWYRDTLGLPHLFTSGPHAFFDCHGVRLYLSEGNSASTESIIYFSVSDLHAHCAMLKAKGVEFLTAPHLIHRHADGREEWMAFFKDHEARPLALMSVVAPAGGDESSTQKGSR